MSFTLCLNEQFWRDKFRIRLPPVREINGNIQAMQSIKHFTQCATVTPSTLPVDELTCSATICFPYPVFVFLHSGSATFHQARLPPIRQALASRMSQCQKPWPSHIQPCARPWRFSQSLEKTDRLRREWLKGILFPHPCPWVALVWIESHILCICTAGDRDGFRFLPIFDFRIFGIA